MRRNHKARAPLRIGLSGGGTDIEDYIQNTDSAVINSTICLICICSIKRLKLGHAKGRGIGLSCQSRMGYN